MRQGLCYVTGVFEKEPDFCKAPVAAIDSFHWEGKNPYRPRTTAQLCAVEDKGIHYRAFTDETELRAEWTQRDDPVYEDSCLELFLNPCPELSPNYLNVEVNPNGAFLCQFGPDRENRRWVREMTDLSPEVAAERTADGWGIRIFLSDAFLRSLYGPDYRTCKRAMRGNFYKCGDNTVHPHYAAFAPVGTLPPGFHNPDYFADITLL